MSADADVAASSQTTSKFPGIFRRLTIFTRSSMVIELRKHINFLEILLQHYAKSRLATERLQTTHAKFAFRQLFQRRLNYNEI